MLVTNLFDTSFRDMSPKRLSIDFFFDVGIFFYLEFLKCGILEIPFKNLELLKFSFMLEFIISSRNFSKHL